MQKLFAILKTSVAIRFFKDYEVKGAGAFYAY
jgi:hypothetical protein